MFEIDEEKFSETPKYIVHINTGIITFSRLGGFYANLGSAQIFFLPPEKGVFSTNGK